MIKKVLFGALVFFYLVAGMNHFIMPEFYYPLIPDYLPNKVVINTISGVIEILLACGLLIPNTRKWSALGIILLLLAFIPAHVHFILIGGCVDASLCVPDWVAWVRLLVIHPVLIYWAWYFKNYKWN